MPAGYSQTPLIKKLGIKPGHRACFLALPDTVRHEIGPLPEGVVESTSLRGRKDYVHLFATKRSDLERRLPTIKAHLEKGGLCWISWPKKTSGVQTDLDGNAVRRTGLAAGLVDIKVCAVDETWSGLKFVFRRDDR